jgi:hypothetical protein
MSLLFSNPTNSVINIVGILTLDIFKVLIFPIQTSFVITVWIRKMFQVMSMMTTTKLQTNVRPDMFEAKVNINIVHD